MLRLHQVRWQLRRVAPRRLLCGGQRQLAQRGGQLVISLHLAAHTVLGEDEDLPQSALPAAAGRTGAPAGNRVLKVSPRPSIFAQGPVRAQD